MLTTVHLHGKLGDAIGRSIWTLSVESAAEAIRAIEAQTKRLYRHLASKTEEGVEYRVVADGQDIAGDPNNLLIHREAAELHIIPVPQGASAGLWETIAGVVLIIVGIILIETPIGGYLIMAGITLTLGGLMSLFFGPKPPITQTATKDRGDETKNQQSYAFNGPVNTIAQGGPVPLLYGFAIVGSQTISMGIHTSSRTIKGDAQVTPDLRTFTTYAAAAAFVATKVHQIDEAHKAGDETLEGAVEDEVGGDKDPDKNN